MNMRGKWMLGVAAGLLSAGTVTAQVPATFNYQGRLLDGTNLVNGAQDFIVKLYTTDSGGTALYTETNASVSVVDGLYTFTVGDDAAGLPQVLTNATLYLELVVGTQTLAPRERLTSSAYSILAAGVQAGGVLSNMIAAGAVAGPHLANDAVVDAKVAAGANINPAKVNGTALTQLTTFNGDVNGLWNNLQIQANAVGPIELQANSVRSTHIIDGQIIDADVSATAAIQPAKINGTALTQGTVFAGDVAGSYNTLQIVANAVGNPELANNAVVSGNILDGTIVDADIALTANIRGTKVQPGSVLGPGTVQLAPSSTGTLVIAQGAKELRSFGIVNTFTAAAPGTALSIVGGLGIAVSNLLGNVVQINAQAVGLPNLDNVIWVATNGTPAGPGTIAQPFDTPQNGYNAAALQFGGQPAAVVIAAGRYPGSLLMNAGNVHVIGLGRPQIMGALQVLTPAAPILVGWQRVEGLVIEERTQVLRLGGEVKFHNCRMNGGLDFFGDHCNAQDCFVTSPTDDVMVMAALQMGSGQACANLGIYNCSVQFAGLGPAIDIFPGVTGCEIIGCEVIHLAKLTAIRDQQTMAMTPLHLISHNYIRGPMSDEAGPNRAIMDMGALTMAIHQNTIWGDVGTGMPQYVAQNMVYGIIYSMPGPGVWTTDANGNTTLTVPQGIMPQLPDVWRD